MATQAPAAAPVVHPLTLKVMRLFLPGLEVRMPDPVAELRPYPGGAATAAASAAAGGGSGPGPGPAGDDGLSVDEARYGLTGLIRLPVEFGTIYLGQYFSAYIVVANYSGYDVDNVHLMAELQTGSQRVQLTDKRLSSKAGQYLTPAPTNPAPYFAVGQTIDMAIDKLLNEVRCVCVCMYVCVCVCVCVRARDRRWRTEGIAPPFASTSLVRTHSVSARWEG